MHIIAYYVHLLHVHVTPSNRDVFADKSSIYKAAVTEPFQNNSLWGKIFDCARQEYIPKSLQNTSDVIRNTASTGIKERDNN